MFTKKFVLDALERAIKTFAQFVITLAGFSGVTGDFTKCDWKFILINSAIGFGLSIMFSIASSFKSKDSASLVK